MRLGNAQAIFPNIVQKHAEQPRTWLVSNPADIFLVTTRTIHAITGGGGYCAVLRYRYWGEIRANCALHSEGPACHTVEEALSRLLHVTSSLIDMAGRPGGGSRIAESIGFTIEDGKVNSDLAELMIPSAVGSHSAGVVSGFSSGVRRNILPQRVVDALPSSY